MNGEKDKKRKTKRKKVINKTDINRKGKEEM